jgi:hypothetical protein
MRASAGLVAATLLVAGLGLGGCAAVKKADHAVKDVHTIEHTVRGNRATIDSFTKGMQSSETATFEATYVTTGKSPTTVVYAVQPPKGLAFTDTPSNGKADGVGRVDIVANATGEYLCTPPSGSQSATQCERASAVNAATENKVFAFYTPAHWVAFLKGFSLAAGFAGDKVSSSTKTLNGYSMQCVDFVAAGVKGTSTICTAAQGILGYVKVAQDNTSFELKSYSASPPASLFQLPAGAKVTTVSTTAP